MKMQTLLFTALLGLACTAAYADEDSNKGGANTEQHEGMCAKNADECTQLAAKFDSWCQANAQKCVAAKARMEKHREMCEKNKDKCEDMMEHRHHHGDEDKDNDKGGDDNGG